jgi:hypothetical protein
LLRLSPRLAKTLAPALLFAIFASQLQTTECQISGLSEYEVKAAFLLNFAKFIQWPQNAFANDQSPLFICIVGEDPFGHTLDEVVQSKMLDSHAFIIRHSTNPEDMKTCQVVFIGSRDDKRLSEVLRRLKGSNALAVGESRDFAGLGGGIQFYLENNRIRFLVNVDALQRAHLTASSKLLALAKIVHDGRRNDD